MNDQKIACKDDLNIEIEQNNTNKDIKEGHKNNTITPNNSNPNLQAPNDEYEISYGNKPLYSEKGLLLWYFSISTVILAYDLFFHYTYNPLNTMIESNIDGPEIFKYDDSEGALIFFVNMLFGVILICILRMRTIINKMTTRFRLRDTLKRIIRLLSGLLTIFLLWITIGMLSIGGRVSLTRTFVFLLIFANVFITIKSWKFKAILLTILIVFGVKSLSQINIPEETQITKYLQSNNIEGSKYIDFINKYNFKPENVTVVDNSILAFALSVYIPGIFKSITIGSKLMDERLFESFKGIFIHELGHIIYYHSLMSLFTTFAFFGILLLFTNKFFKGIEMERMIYGMFLISVADKLFSLCSNVVGQYLEYQADNFIAINEPNLVIPSMYALVKSHANNSNKLKFGFFYPLFSPNFTHPSVFHRIKALGLETDRGMINLTK